MGKTGCQVLCVLGTTAELRQWIAVPMQNDRRDSLNYSTNEVNASVPCCAGTQRRPKALSHLSLTAGLAFVRTFKAVTSGTHITISVLTLLTE